jgi:hypothetical protein
MEGAVSIMAYAAAAVPVIVEHAVAACARFDIYLSHLQTMFMSCQSPTDNECRDPATAPRPESDMEGAVSVIACAAVQPVIMEHTIQSLFAICDENRYSSLFSPGDTTSRVDSCICMNSVIIERWAYETMPL